MCKQKIREGKSTFPWIHRDKANMAEDIAVVASASRFKLADSQLDNIDVEKINTRTLHAESLRGSNRSSLSLVQDDDDEILTDERLEELLLQRIGSGDNLSKFQLGQFYFEREMYAKAFTEFLKIEETDIQAKYQLGVMYYDGLGVIEDAVRTLLSDCPSEWAQLSNCFA